MCDLCLAFNNDKPFRFHRTDSDTNEVLIGKIANKYMEEFEKQIYPHAMSNSLMTAVVGRPGAGKTQLLHYLKNSSLKNKNRACSILELKDTKIDYDYLLNHICNDNSILNYFSNNGYDLKGTEKTKSKIIKMGKAINEICISTQNENVGFCLLVDSVDEYLRKINSYYQLDRNQIIENLLGKMMILLNDIPRLCIIFAITRDVMDEFKEALEEISPGRRFSFISDDDGNPLILENFDGEETEEMVAAFLNMWSKRNVPLPNYTGTTTKNGLNIFPFTPNALNLFWRAGDVPGDTSIACLMALNKKIAFNSDKENSSDNLIVTESDAALIIKQFSGYFLNYDSDIFKNKLDSLLDNKQINYELEKISLKAKQVYSNFPNNITDAFKTYLLSIDNDFKFEFGNINRLVRHKNNINNKFTPLDLIIDFKDIKIGIQFVSKTTNETLNNKKREVFDKIESLSQSLINKQIERGLIILVSDDEIQQFYEMVSEKIKSGKLTSKTKGYVTNMEIEYSPVIRSHNLSEKNAWYIFGMNEFLNGADVIRYSKYLEKELSMCNLFKQLIKMEPIVSNFKDELSRGVTDRAE